MRAHYFDSDTLGQPRRILVNAASAVVYTNKYDMYYFYTANLLYIYSINDLNKTILHFINEFSLLDFGIEINYTTLEIIKVPSSIEDINNIVDRLLEMKIFI